MKTLDHSFVIRLFFFVVVFSFLFSTLAIQGLDQVSSLILEVICKQMIYIRTSILAMEGPGYGGLVVWPIYLILQKVALRAIMHCLGKY